MRHRSSFIAFVLVLTAAVTACSGEATPTVPGPRQASTTNDPTDVRDSGTVQPLPEGPDASRTGDSTLTCAAEVTITACQTCCYGTYPAGSIALVKEMADCECGPKGPCDNACASTLCATPMVASDAKCTACVGANLTGICASVLTRCGASPECASALACLQGCTGKP